MAVFNIYNADGSLQFSMRNRLARIIGNQVVGSGQGSIVVPTTGGQVWAFFVLSGTQFAEKRLRVNGNVVSWEAYAPGGTLTLYYGEY